MFWMRYLVDVRGVVVGGKVCGWGDEDFFWGYLKCLWFRWIVEGWKFNFFVCGIVSWV